MFAWWRDLTTRARRTMAALVAGWSRDARDMRIFRFVIPSLLAVCDMAAARLATVTLVVSLIGDWNIC